MHNAHHVDTESNSVIQDNHSVTPFLSFSWLKTTGRYYKETDV